MVQKIDQLPIVRCTGPIMWRAGAGLVTATVRDKSVMFRADWPIDARNAKAAALRLAQDFPDIADEIRAAT